MVSEVAELRMRSFLHQESFSFRGRVASVEFGTQPVASRRRVMSFPNLGDSLFAHALSNSSSKKAICAHRSTPAPLVRAKGGDGTTFL
eukprot:7929446-Pyramimonas_sp.AAC.1